MIPKSGQRFSDKDHAQTRKAPRSTPSPARNVRVALRDAFTLPISPVISMTSGALGEAGGPMTTIRAYRSIPLALVAAVGLWTVASAQQGPPAKQAKPATKSETKSETKSPPQAKQPAPAPAGAGG